MNDSVAHSCRLDYMPAYHASGERHPEEVYWIVLHDEEAPSAVSAASYFKSPSSGGSAHLCVDDTVCYRCLSNTAIPWGAASAPQIGANTHGFHIEQAGYAKWSAVIWRSHRKTLERAAYKTAYHCHVFKIPPVFVAADELPGKHGITTHAEVTKASKRLDPAHAYRYDHTDPGPFWPRRDFMNLVSGYYASIGKKSSA
jgi:hypothetical protein